jgi:tripartite-type tricarboxylate transporter receptor subunit TctC
MLRLIAMRAFEAGLLILATQARADPVEDFYRGKTIDMYVGSSAGAGYDAYARLVARFLSTYIPGHPVIVARNMPGAEGRAAAAYLYNVAPKDGLALLAFNRSAAVGEVLGTKLNYRIADFNWIGTPSGENSTMVTWHTTGVKSIADAKNKEVTIGAAGDGAGFVNPAILNKYFGTRFKVVRGYPGGNEINLAMERDEVGGRGSNSWGSWKTGRSNWLAQHKINVILQVGLLKEPDLPDAPLLLDLAQNPEQQRLFRVYSALVAGLGHPFLTAPNVPQERVAALRAAFDAMMKDAAFVREAERAHLELANPLSGTALQDVVADISSVPDSLRAQLKELQE